MKTSWRNAYAPLGVSLDYSRRHALAGETLRVPVWVMSDADEAKGRVEVEAMLVEGRPSFRWDGASEGPVPSGVEGLKVVSRECFTADVAAWGAEDRLVTLRAPLRAENCTLAAALRQDGRTVAISLRPLRVYEPLAKPAKARSVAVIERDGRIEAWLRARGHRVVLASGAERPEVLVVGEGMGSDGLLRAYGFELAERVRRGGMRVVMLEQCAWNPGGFEGKLLEGLVSSPLREPAGQVHPEPAMERFIGTSADFRRLNGLGGLALRVRLELPPAAPAPAKSLGTGQPDPSTALGAGKAAGQPASTETKPEPVAEKSPWRPLMSAMTRSLDKPDWAVVYRRSGAGDIFACQVPLTGRIDRSKPADFDPVAERLLAWLIETEALPEDDAAPHGR